MSLQTRLSTLISAIGADIKALQPVGWTWTPARSGLVGWNFDINNCSANSGGLTTLRPFLSKIVLPVQTTIANVLVDVGSAGASLVAGSNEIGIYSSTGTLLAKATGLQTTWNTTGLKTIPVTVQGGQSITNLPAGTVIYVMILASGTTMPGFSRLATLPSAAAMNGLLTTTTGFRFAQLAAVVSGTGVPASFTLASTTAATGAPWVGLS